MEKGCLRCVRSKLNKLKIIVEKFAIFKKEAGKK